MNPLTKSLLTDRPVAYQISGLCFWEDNMSAESAQPISLEEAVDQYMDSLHRYEISDDQPSYSIVEIPKLQIADQILKLLDLPTGPRSNKQW